MYTLEHIIDVESTLMQKIIERDGQIRQLLQGADDLHGQVAEKDRRIAELEAQLKALTGESIKEGEHGANPGPR